MSLIQDALKRVQGGPSARTPLGGVQYGRGRPSRSRWPWRLIGASVAAVALLFFVVKVPGLLLGRRLPAKPVRSVPAAQTGAQPTAPPAVSGSAELTVEAPSTRPSVLSSGSKDSGQGPSAGLPRAESRGSGRSGSAELTVEAPVEPPAVSTVEPPSSSLPAGAAASSSSPSAARRVPPAVDPSTGSGQGPSASLPRAESRGSGRGPVEPPAVSPAEPPEAAPPIRATLRGEPFDKLRARPVDRPAPSGVEGLRAEPSRTAPIPEERVANPAQVGPPDSRPSRVGEKPDPTPPVEVDALSSGAQEAAPTRTLRPVVEGKDRYHFNMGLFYQKQGQYAQAFAAYQKTVELNPFHVEAYNNLGVLYKEVGEVDKAIQHYRKALAIDPHYVKAHNNLGVTLTRQGKLTEATAQFEHALELNPKNLESYTNLGVIYRRLSRMPEAVRAFEAALSIDPEHAESHYNLAILLEGQGRIAEALAHYRRFVASAEPRHRSVVARVIAHIQLLGQGTAGPAATRKLSPE